ncbi:MAG: TRAP transporter large permease subunit [Rhodopseudomonas sp.]|nr:TRAP transporter large permease subunit [Rhodopseudomonas sp.]
MNTVFLFITLLTSLALGLPIAMALGLASILEVLIFEHDSLASLALSFFQTMDQFTLLAIPFFILAANFLTTGGVARRMINFAIAAVGHLQGGLAIASVLACMLFAAVSGSSPATVVAIGSIVIAGMVRAGYSQSFATGVIVNAGTLGILIPPSIVMVVFAAATETSVGRLFMAGVVPGILLGTILMVAIYVAARVKKLPRQPKVPWLERLRLFREAMWGLLLIVIVMGGIYGGIFTPTEAAAVAAVYAFFAAVVIYRDLHISEVPRVLLDSGRVSVMLMFIIGNAFLFGHVLTTSQIPQSIAQMVTDANMAPWHFLLIVNIILLVAGNFMDPSAIVLITAPILFPTAIKLGIDPIHLGIIYVVNMEIGLVTPPVGLNLFVASGITKMPLVDVVKAAMPWLTLLIGFLVVVTYIPEVSLWLPNMLFGPALK